MRVMLLLFPYNLNFGETEEGIGEEDTEDETEEWEEEALK